MSVSPKQQVACVCWYVTTADRAKPTLLYAAVNSAVTDAVCAQALAWKRPTRSHSLNLTPLGFKTNAVDQRCSQQPPVTPPHAFTTSPLSARLLRITV
jgi:hypothetical protein